MGVEGGRILPPHLSQCRFLQTGVESPSVAQEPALVTWRWEGMCSTNLCSSKGLLPRQLCPAPSVQRNQKPWGRAGPGHMVGGLNLRSEACVCVCTWEVRSGEAGRVPKWRTPAPPVGSPDSQGPAFPFGESCATLATFGVRFLLIRPPWVVGAPVVATVISRCVSLGS